LWWFADCIQYDNQRKLQKRAPPILSGKIHALADSFISRRFKSEVQQCSIDDMAE
jgi:hypothetical protein